MQALLEAEDGTCTPIETWRDAGEMQCEAGALEPTGETAVVGGWFGGGDIRHASVYQRAGGGSTWLVLVAR